MVAIKKPSQKAITKKFLNEPVVFHGTINGTPWRSTTHLIIVQTKELSEEPKYTIAGGDGRKTITNFLDIYNPENYTEGEAFNPDINDLQKDFLIRTIDANNYVTLSAPYILIILRVASAFGSIIGLKIHHHKTLLGCPVLFTIGGVPIAYLAPIRN